MSTFLSIVVFFVVYAMIGGVIGGVITSKLTKPATEEESLRILFSCVAWPIYLASRVGRLIGRFF